ncbi:MAG: hypothetical protein KC583_17280, partial [Myxococcales bacterium]|nr:hypothetical protein [Myxococcales bacterium]
HGIDGAGTPVSFLARTRVVALMMTDGRSPTDLNEIGEPYLMVQFEDPVDDICTGSVAGSSRSLSFTPTGGEPGPRWVYVGAARLPTIKPYHVQLLDARGSGAEVTVVITRNCTLRAIYH